MNGRSDFHSSINTVEFKNNHLTCPICFDVFVKPLVCGSCGNSFCAKCVADMKNVCPLCRIVTKYSPNATLENLILNLPIMCKCNKFFLKSEMENHTKLCPAHEQKCKYCEFVGNIEQRTIHGIDKHSEIITRFYLVFKG